MATDDRQQRVRDLYDSAVALEPVQRSAFLSEVCGGDVELEHQLRMLLQESTRRGSPEEARRIDAADDADATHARTGSIESAAAPVPARQAAAPLGMWGALELLERVGAGSFGETYRARDVRLDRIVALKLLDRPASQQGAGETSIVREGARLARVRHPNIATVHGAALVEGRIGLWMEFVEGRTLESLVAQHGPLPAREATSIGIDLCAALGAVHRAGLLHRDIKAANVIRENGGRIVLVDFGSSVEPDPLARDDAVLAGTPLYMAPELFRGERASVQSDIYSLGVLLYRLVSGAYPVLGRNLDDLAKAHEQRLRIGVPGQARDEKDVVTPGTAARWRELRAVRPELPERFIAIVDRCLCPRPEARYSSAAAVQAALGSATADLTGYYRARVAEWSDGRFSLDTEFISLDLLVDTGEETLSGRWSVQPEAHRDLGTLLAGIDAPAVVLLGPPGSGKSTLLRRFELEVARRALDGAADGGLVTFYVSLNQYGAVGQAEPPDPAEWLAIQWRARYPDLPTLDALLEEGRVVLLLDGLNEMPASQAEGVRRWKRFIQSLAAGQPGNRAVFSCRTLDYSAPLSTPALRVPHVRIAPLTDDQVQRFLAKRSPQWGTRIWDHLRAAGQLEVIRSPFLLRILTDRIELTNGIPIGRAHLFTELVRQAMRRELEGGNPLFVPDRLLTERDARRLTQWAWKSRTDLPEHGLLVPALTELAAAMQGRSGTGDPLTRLGYQDVIGILHHPSAPDVVRAGGALGVLEEDPATDDVQFTHQVIQEYFAGRRLAAAPEPQRARVAVLSKEVAPSFEEVLRTLPAGETAPPLPATGWEEPMLFAAEITADPCGFIQALSDVNLELAGRCAAQTAVRAALDPDVMQRLRWRLAEQASTRAVDLRARIGARLALGALGDPRVERRRGPHGDYLVPPMVAIPEGRYPIGEDRPFSFATGGEWTDHMPRHEVRIAPFRIAQFPVTNAEWALFMESGGYDDEGWWDTPSALRWQSGEGTAEANAAQVRYWFRTLRESPELMDEKLASGLWDQRRYDRWKALVSKTDAEFEAHLRTEYPGGKLREPLFWRRPEANNPVQPVVGICWFEARAFANWLTAQTGDLFRLPTEVEWEAAARGRNGRIYPYGDEFDPLRGNTAETRLRRPAPVGVFPEGDTPEGVSDLAGNVVEWTSTMYGSADEDGPLSFGYPYNASDGRENPAAGPDVHRVARGGAWNMTAQHARAACRMDYAPGFRYFEVGFRLASSSPG